MHAIARTTIVLGCATALGLLPVLTASPGSVFDGFGQHAHAKGGEGNGGGNGGGNGNGNGGGNGGGRGDDNGGGRGEGHGGKGGPGSQAAARSGGDKDGSKGGGRNAGKGVADFIGGIFGGGRGKGKGDEAGTGRGMAGNKGGDQGRGSGKPSLAAQQETALKGKAVPVPALKEEAREKNIHAKLGGLNSLNRSYQAYMNANDPKFAAIQAYVLASANAEMTAAELETAIEAQATAQADLIALEARMAELERIPAADRTAEQATELSGLPTAIAEARTALDDATQAVADLNTESAELETATTDEALMEALQAGANPNRTVDQEMVDWAKEVLGVEDAYGRIDQVREALETETSSTEADADDEAETEDDAYEVTEAEQEAETELVQAAE